MKNKPKPHQAPVAQTPNAPDDYTDVIVKKRDIQAELEADERARGNDWNDSSKAYFDEFKKKAGE